MREIPGFGNVSSGSASSALGSAEGDLKKMLDAYSRAAIWSKAIQEGGQEKAATFFPGKNLHYKPKKYLDSYKRINFFCLVHFKNRETSKILNSVFFDCFSQLVISFSANFFV